MRSPCTLEFKFTAGAHGIPPGGGVLFHVSPFWDWSKPQIDDSRRPGYTTIRGLKNLDHRLDVSAGEMPYLILSIKNQELKPGESIIIRYGANPERGGAAFADRFAESAQEFIFKTDGDGDGRYQNIPIQPVVEVLPGEPSVVLVTGPSVVAAGERFRFTIALLDSGGNLIRNWTDNLQIKSSRPDFRSESIKDYSQGRPLEWSEPAARKPVQLEVFLETHALGGVSNPIWVRDDPDGMQVFWGDIHGHTVLSDGTGTPNDYFEYARDASGLDFAAITDHDSWGFNPLQANLDVYCEAIKKYNSPGLFVTFFGYEWTQWDDGHRNVYFPSDCGPVFDNTNPAFNSPAQLNDALSSFDVLVVPHHLGGGPVPFDTGFQDDRTMRIAEVTSVHGISESSHCDRRIYNSGPNGFFRDALLDTRKWGAIASSDSHDGHPGLRTHGQAVRGVVAVFAVKLDRNSVFEALKNRRCYGTTGARMFIDFSVNGVGMGGEFTAASDVPHEIRLNVMAEDDLERIALVRNGSIVHYFYGNGLLCEASWTAPPSEVENGFYYCIVQQMDGETGITSPVWFHSP